MAKSRREDQPALLGEPPDEVWVTVTVIPGPRGRSVRERMAELGIRLNLAMVIGLCAVAVAIVALLVVVVLGGAGGQRAQPRDIGAQVASRGNPPRCSSVAIDPHHPRLRLAEFDRAVWCARAGAHVNASIDQFVGAP